LKPKTEVASDIINEIKTMVAQIEDLMKQALPNFIS